MSQAKNGDNVKIHYTGKLENGNVFDTSKDREPLEFVLGEGKVIKGFDSGIMGMEQGETKVLTIPPEEAYGTRNEELKGTVKRDQFPEEITPEIGMPIQMTAQNGNPVNVVITAFDDETVSLDANHPLAGKALIFDIELVELAQG